MKPTKTLLACYAPWCPTCQQVEKQFVDLSNMHNTNITYIAINIDANKALMKELNIKAIPTFVFFKNGNVVGKIVGVEDVGTFTQSMSKKIQEILS